MWTVEEVNACVAARAGGKSLNLPLGFVVNLKLLKKKTLKSKKINIRISD